MKKTKPMTKKEMAKPMMKKEMASKMKTYAKGGGVSSASKRADGIAMKGKTKGKVVKMMMGGKAC